MRWMFERVAGPFFGGAKCALLIIGLLGAGTTPALAKVEPPESRTYYEKALKHVDQGDLRAAVVELKNALQRDPGNAEARLLLGNIYLQFGDGASAEKELRSAERNGIATERTIVPLGQALLLQGQFKKVLGGFDPESFDSEVAYELRLLRAGAHTGLREFAKARAAYEDAAKSRPADARIPLGLARIDLAEGKLDAAGEQAAAAIALIPGLPEAVLLRAEVMRQGGAPEAAVALYRDILDGAPVPVTISLRARLGLAAALIALDRDVEAQSEVAAVQSIVPALPLAVYLKALIELRSQDFAAARKTLENSGPVLDGFAPAQFLSGAVYFAIGQLETARVWLIRHLEAHPENLQARKLLGATLLRLNVPADAATVLGPGLRQAPEDPQLLLLVGNAYIRTGRAAQASDLLQRAAALAPKDPRVLSQLAISQMSTGQNDEALASLNATLDLGADASAIGYALAFAHLRAGEFGDVLKVAQTLRKRFPDSALAANLEGGAYAALGQLDKARESFQAGLDIDPAFHEARANLAALKAKAGDIDGAEAEYRKVLDTDKTNTGAMMGLASAADARGDRQGTRRWLEKAVETDPQAVNPALMLARNYAAADEFPAAVEVLDTLSRQQAPNLQVLVELGAIQIEAGQPADAVETYNRLVETTGGAINARSLLANAQVETGETQAARQTLEQALAAYPDHRPTAEALVRLVSRLDGQEAGFAYAEQLRRDYPDASWADQVVGDLQWRAGDLNAAIATYEAGWAKRPSSSLAVALSRARLQQAGQQRKKGKAALAPLRQWLDQHPDDDAARQALAESLLSLGELDAARAEYETLKQTQAGNPSVWNNLAWLYQQAGDQRAVSHGERALSLAPDQPAVLDTLGWILVGDGQVDRAATLLNKAYQAAPDNGDIAYHYAVALHEAGDDAAARQILQRLLESGTHFSAKSEAKALLSKLPR